MSQVITTRTLVSGNAVGEVIALEPLSFWGGFDVQTGRVCEPRHPQFECVLTGKIVKMVSGRGSSSSSSIIAEAIRLGTAPLAFLLRETDAIIATGGMVAAELYNLHCPVLVVSALDWDRLRSGSRAQIRTDGNVATLSLD
jgi:predicted aconitase with swiveling domain